MKKHTKIYYKAHGIDYDESLTWRPYVSSELGGGRANDIHHIKHKGRRVNSICALMAVTSDQHKRYGETGRDEELIEVHFEFLKDQITRGFDLMPLIKKDIEKYDCELSKRFVCQEERK